MIVLDSSVLSVVLRRERPAPLAERFARLVEQDAPLGVPGVVLQEILSGVRSEVQFTRLQRALEAFPVLLADTAGHVRAAQISNACRRRGIAASNTDCLIAALTIGLRGELWTLDADFQRIAGCCALRLFPR